MLTTIQKRIPFLVGFLLTFGGYLSAQINANFAATQTSGCGIVQTAFSDLSTSGPNTGIIDSWTWDFEVGNSNLQNPGFTFSTTGVYTVCLTVSTTTGDSDTDCKTDYIEVFSLPIPDFAVDEPTGCVSHTVNFTDQTNTTTSIASYIWGVGGQSGVIIDDGSLPSITNTYDNADDYTISLTVEDENGCVNSITKPGFITVSENPTIQVTPDVAFSCDPPLVTTFFNDNIQPDVEYTWDFGNGQIFNGTTPNPVIYTAPGSYTVSVSATNTIAGCTSNIVMTDLINIGHPVAISADQQTICLGETVNFSDDSETPADTYTWDFGDGNTASTADASHTYTTAGCHTVTLTRDVGGCVSTTTLPFCVQVNDLPTGTYSSNAPIGCSLPHATNFVATVPPGSQVLWDFGDGNTSAQQNPTHSYQSFGTYQVTILITNANGCQTTLTGETVTIQETVPQLAFNFETGCVPLNFSLNENSTSVVPIDTWLWEIIDDAAIPPIVFSSTLENPLVSIPDTGVYDVRLTVTNTLGCSATRTFAERIKAGASPNTNFSVDPANACIEQAITFTDGSTQYADEWFWDFGDGELSVDQNPVHDYEGIGPFTVTLVSSHNGCTDTLVQQDIIRVMPPKANFDVTHQCVDYNLREFTNQSDSADIWHWDFGVETASDDTSNLENPSFTYPGPGSYWASLITENITTGCTDTLLHEVVITDLTPQIQITDSVGCAPFVLDVSNSTVDANIYSWNAPGANINDVSLRDPVITYPTGGTYQDVQLVVEDIHGCVDTITLDAEIEVNELTAQLTPSTIASCAGTQVDFTNTSTATYNTIVSSSWDVGPGLGSFDTPDAAFAFASAGDYQVVLTVTDDGGCSNTVTHPELINITDPEAAYSSEKYACTFSPLAINSESIGEGLNFAWDFGDGNASNSPNPTHQFGTEGQYDVCLTVTDKNGCIATTCEDEKIIVVDPVASFSVDNAYGACPPMLASFVNNSSNAINYYWDFGDNSGTSDLESPPHVFTEPGTFDVKLVAYTSAVCTDTLTIEDYIVLEGPIGDFSFTTDNLCAPGVVTFEAGSIDQYDYYWDYGDGTIDTTFNVDNDTLEYSYSDIGTFTPKLILVDNQSCQRVITPTDSIVMGGFNYEFEAVDSIYCGDEGLTTLMFFDGETSHPLQEITWLLPGSETPVSGTALPIATYNTPGVYDVQLILDNGACRDTLTKENYIRIGATPDAQLVADVTDGCYPLTVNFTDQSSVNGGSITDWNWDFGNGNTSNNPNPTMMFDEVGNNSVDLTVTSDIGCEESRTVDIEVFALPVAEIAGETNVCIGETALLQGTVISGATGGTATWTGGPVNCSDCLETVATPGSTTTYTLSVVDGNNCTTSEVFEVYVRDAVAPIIDLGPDTSACIETGIELALSVDQSMVTLAWETDQEGLSCYDNCPNPLATPTENTLYVVNATNVDGCKATDSILVAVIDDRREFATADLTICEGDSTQLSINYGTNAVWMANGEVICNDCPDLMAGPMSPTEYQVEVRSENGCLIKDTVAVELQAPMEVEAGDATVSCINAGVTLTGSGTGSASWYPVAGTAAPSELETLVIPSETTMYYLTVDDGICRSLDSVLVEVVTKAEVSAFGGELCQGDTISIVGEGTASDYVWYDENESVVGSGEVLEIIPSSTAGYSLVGTLNGCEPDTADFAVNVYELPEMEYPENMVILPETSVQISPSQGDQEGLVFAWSPTDDLSCGDCPNPFASPADTKTYSVEILDPSTGCSVTEEIELRLRTKCGPDMISVPNVFSPNNDGRNDFIHLLSSSISRINNFKVFDRWGSTVFATTDIAEGWNGVFHGKKLPAGVYVYVIEATCPIDNSTFYKKGDITILR